jgi:hypothetical protein
MNEKINFQKKLVRLLHLLILVLSIAMIVFLSVDVFSGVAFLKTGYYMQFQLVVCIAFILDFVIEMWAAERRMRYFWRHLMMLLISIPYNNIIDVLGIEQAEHVRDILHVVPFARASLALAVVVGYISENKIAGLFARYLAIMVLVVYFSSIIFYAKEAPVNTNVTSYGISLWWCCLEATTLGAPFSPVTVIGKVLACVTSLMGIVMFPLFTVYLGDVVKRMVRSKI